MDAQATKKQADSAPRAPKKSVLYSDDHSTAIKDALKSFAKSASLGIGLKTSMNLLSMAVSGKSRPLSQVLDTRFGMFLGTFAGVNKLVLHALYTLRKEQLKDGEDSEWWWSVVSGSLAGLASFDQADPGEHTTLAMYSLVRAGHFLLKAKASQGQIPEALAKFEHWDTVVMCISAAQILYCYFYFDQYHSPSYKNFLRKQGGKDPKIVKAIETVHHGKPFKMEALREMYREKGVRLSDVFTVPTSTPGVFDMDPCDAIHPHMTCTRHFFNYVVYGGISRAAKMYGPLHTIYGVIILISKLRAGKKGDVPDAREKELEAKYAAAKSSEERQSIRTRLLLHKVLKKVVFFLVTLKNVAWTTAKNVLFSSVFLALYCGIAWFGLCFGSMLSRKGLLNTRAPSMSVFFRLLLSLCGLPTLLEYKSRRMELAMFCLPRAIETVRNKLVEHASGQKHVCGSLSPMPWVDKVIFSLSAAGLIYCHQNHPDSIKSSFKNVFDFMWA
eukprot:TRINITY_DN3036_c0_g1_i1.p1 TRINITY_DN3036_c0_g1~~TRINITY_DN3036_c0_g1_i1.p1  ORF type:complete len:517 (+),score=183.17 TRINITY_DN3036_c0_g1_i1:56-1552(+)